ncbi:MAG: hypothetical protein IPJ77_17440 [Planctomycetes bacterium]|nr:hypothetical protein [Planctomycetota bacterium]
MWLVVGSGAPHEQVCDDPRPWLARFDEQRPGRIDRAVRMAPCDIDTEQRRACIPNLDPSVAHDLNQLHEHSILVSRRFVVTQEPVEVADVLPLTARASISVGVQLQEREARDGGDGDDEACPDLDRLAGACRRAKTVHRHPRAIRPEDLPRRRFEAAVRHEVEDRTASMKEPVRRSAAREVRRVPHE